MRIRKIVLSVIAFLLLSLCFLGVNAENADFSYYPLNLFHDGVFNGFIVIGDDAAPDDVIGAVEVGMSLQYAAGEKDMFILPELIRELPGSYKFDKTGNHFSGSIDSIADIQQILGEDDLPVILADGRYSDSEGETENDETYQQTIRFFDHATSTVVKRYQPKGRAAGSYMKIDDANATYLYSLEFDNPIYYTNTSTSGQRPSDDLEDTMIKIQGKDYTITHVTDKGALGSYAIDSITLMAGDTLVWLQQGKTLFVTIAGIGHEIEVADVNDLEDMCGVSVDGDVAWLKKGESRTVNGIRLGVTDAVAVHAQLQDVDLCRINLGATEIKLKDGDEVDVDGVNVEGSECRILQTPGKWSGLNISYRPEDDLYLTSEDEFLDGVFKNFKLVFGGINSRPETISIETLGSDEAQMVFNNNDGREVVIPFFFNGSNVIPGEDEEAFLLQEGQVCDRNSIQDCEGTLIFAVSSGKEVHILKVANIDTNNDEIDFKDVTYGKTYHDKKYTDSTTTPTIFNFGSLGQLSLVVDETNDNLNITDVSFNDAETSYGALLTLRTDGPNSTIHILEEEHDETRDYETNFSFVLQPDLTEDEIDIIKPADELVWYRNTLNGLLAAPAGTCFLLGWSEAICAAQMGAGTFGADAKSLYEIRSLLLAGEGWVDVSEGNSDVKYSSTLKSAVLWDKDNTDFATLSYADDEPTIDFYISPADSELNIIEEIETVNLSPINVGAVVLASEIEGREKDSDIISLGGPCANKVSALLMGLEFPSCSSKSTIKQGTGILRSFDNNGNISIVAAGYEAAGTRASARVLADYNLYGLQGSDLEVVFTSLDDISLREPSSQEPAEESAETVVDASGKEEKGMLCAGTNPAKKMGRVRTSKWGIEIEAESETTIAMRGTQGTITIVPDRAFKAQLGVDWIKRTLHIFKGDCSSHGEEVFSTTITWLDGDRTKTADITVPEQGCYCFYADNNDLQIDSASIEFADADTFTIDFRT